MALPSESVTAEMVVANADGETALMGSVARQSLPAGVPIARSTIVQPGDRGFLAAVLPKGMRAITIPISEVAGLHGLALPGDRVDIILTYTVAAEGQGGRDIHASETVVSNLRVLAMDQRLGPAPAKVDEDGDAGASPVASTATLEVTPRQAEMITLATQLGTLSLALNSVRDGEGAEGAVPAEKVAKVRNRLAPARFALRQPTFDSDVTSVLPNQAGAIQVVRGASAGLRQTNADAAGAEAAAPLPVETQ
jgi:pilus assembly protein CpaB